MTLTVRQRAKVNAALCIINDQGYSAQTVINAARVVMATGHTPQSAYEKVLNNLAADYPDLGQAIGTMTRLIEASSPATVAQYDHALSSYIETGDDTAMVALAPTIAKDSVALAIHNGEMTQADVATGGLAMALGFEPAPAIQQAFTASLTVPSAPAQAPDFGRYNSSAPDVGLTAAAAQQVAQAAQAAIMPGVS